MASPTTTSTGSSSQFEAVKEEASKVCGEMLADAGPHFWINPDWRVRVTDEAGELVLSLSMRGEWFGGKARA